MLTTAPQHPAEITLSDGRPAAVYIKFDRLPIDGKVYWICSAYIRLEHAKKLVNITGESWYEHPIHDKRKARYDAMQDLLFKLRRIGIEKDDRRAVFQSVSPQYVKPRRPRIRHTHNELRKLMAAFHATEKIGNKNEVNKWARAFRDDLLDVVEYVESHILGSIRVLRTSKTADSEPAFKLNKPTKQPLLSSNVTVDP